MGYHNIKKATINGLIFLYCTYMLGINAENVKIKIVDAPANTNYHSYQSSAKKLTLRVDPAPSSGPAHIRYLNRECFKGTEKGYEYIVCPFQNVTQKEKGFSWNNFHGVLGVWKEWIVENGTLTGMYFTMGEACGLLDREAKVMLNCSTHTRVHTMSEENKCSYTIWLDTPLVCLKGAMQVYHLLNESQLKSWDRIQEEYLTDEITFQCLSKLRRNILIGAGLLSPPQIPETTTENDISILSTTVATPSPCEEEKTFVEKQLADLQLKMDLLLNDYPDVAKELGFALPTNYGVNLTTVYPQVVNTTLNATITS